MQEALTIIFGVGVLTLATVALLNVACLRLHDVQKKDRKTSEGSGTDNRLLYAYVYDGVRAFEAREKLRSLPAFLGWTGAGAIAFMQLLGGIAYLTTSPSERESAAIFDVVTWATIAAYVLALLFVAAWVSNKVYGVLSEVNRD